MRTILQKSFFERPTVVVAKELLGKYLVRKRGSKKIACMIVETEAYDGFKDKASHAHRGKTARNEVMFGHAGHWYVYFTYGMHFMLNVVTGKREYPAAVLIRGVLCNGKIMDGPAKLTKFLKIDKILNTLPAVKKSGLWIENRGVKVKSSEIKRTPRIGVHYAGEWTKKPYRFVLKQSGLPVRASRTQTGARKTSLRAP